jgi:protein-disulfide isomerase
MILPRKVATSALAAVALLLVVVAPAGAAPVGAEKTAIRFAGIQQKGRTLGNPKAPVTITFIHEIKCPFCMEFDRNVLPRLIKRYVRPGRVKIVAYPQVFDWADNGVDSRRATRFAVALGQQNLYWNFIDLFYANQLSESEIYATDEFLSGLSAAIPGADSQLAFATRNTPAVKDVLKQSEQRMAAFGVFGVPSIFIAKTGIRPPKNPDDADRFSEIQNYSNLKAFDRLIRDAEKKRK